MKNRVLPIFLTMLAVTLILAPTSVDIVAEAEQMVYLGGMPIGIGLAENGLIVTGMVDVITDEGAACPARGSEILTGDVLIEFNGIPVSDAANLANLLQKSVGVVCLTFNRGETEYKVSLTPVTDSLTGLKKLGLMMKSGINGVGTMTFILPDSKKFGALGHGITDADTGKVFLGDSGSIYKCRINSFKRPEFGRAGELTGRFLERDHPIGRITLCNYYGVYGIMNEQIDELQLIPVASRKEVKTGEAYIYSTILGESPKRYTIEIVKATSQKKAQEKSMLIRVIDEDLLRETGGILQGMSGSPIVQNGKLIGAVTHVLVNESTLGYGLYIDWMLENVA